MRSEVAHEPVRRAPPPAPVPVVEAPTVERDDPLVGAVVGATYRILWPVARGGMARLYEVEHLGLRRRLAMKVMHPHLFERPVLRARFEREARAAARARSPFAVDVVDFVRLPDDRPAIVSEWLEGEDLEARLVREERIPLDEALAIAADVCRGLAAAHRASVIHRDLKPANVFLLADPASPVRAKLLDFGVARVEGEATAEAEGSPLTHAGSILGTPAYMAPEQARGADEVDARVDVYGVGALLYRMRTGIPPHPPGDPAATLKRVLRDEPRRPTDLDPSMPSAVEAVIQRAMARERELRYPSVEALGEAIDGLRRASTAASPALAPAAPIHAAAGASPGRFTAVVSGLGLGVAAACVVALVIRRELGAMLPDPELRLLRALALLGGAAVSIPMLRRLARAWPSGPAVGVLRRALSGSLVAALSCFGALELASLGRLAADGVVVDPGVATRALVAAALGAAVFHARRPRAT